MFNQMWKYHPKYWEEWLYYFRGKIKKIIPDIQMQETLTLK